MMKTLATTLAIPYRHPNVLLGMKKRGFGAGKWNGFGGKVEIETIEDNIRRETKEECGIEIQRMECAGILDFEFEGNPETVQMHIFRVDDFSGKPKETEEMKPRWFPISEIPFEKMWPDDIFWMHFVLRGSRFKGRFVFDHMDNILRQELREVNML